MINKSQFKNNSGNTCQVSSIGKALDHYYEFDPHWEAILFFAGNIFKTLGGKFIQNCQFGLICEKPD